MVDPGGPKDTVVVTEPGYPVPARGAAFAGARVEALPLLESNGFLPDPDSIDDWDRVALFWVNYPNNPTGAVAPLAFYERVGAARAGARLRPLLRRGLQRALVRPSRPSSALELDDRSNVAVFQTLSKRSYSCRIAPCSAALRSIAPRSLLGFTFVIAPDIFSKE